MLDPDNLKNQRSHQKLRELGGLQGLANKLQTSLERGIQAQELDINSRKAVFGSNQRPPPKTNSLFTLIVECFDDTMLKVLLLASFVSLIIGVINDGWENGWIEGSSIFLAVAIITSVTASNNYVKEKQFQKLQQSQVSNQKVVVIRNGEKKAISTNDLVVGDIFEVAQGMQLPADAILIRSDGIICDEASLTGEADEIDKKAFDLNQDFDSFLIGKTFVKKGSGLAIVVCVGSRSRSGLTEEML